MKSKAWKLAVMAITIVALVASMAFAGAKYTMPGINAPSDENNELADPAGRVLGVIQWVGIIVAVVMVMYVGIKYMTSTAGKKAEAKETMVPVLIGAALLALGTSIINFVFTAISGSGG
jgi:hypothetical protein